MGPEGPHVLRRCELSTLEYVKSRFEFSHESRRRGRRALDLAWKATGIDHTRSRHGSRSPTGLLEKRSCMTTRSAPPASAKSPHVYLISAWATKFESDRLGGTLRPAASGSSEKLTGSESAIPKADSAPA